jgi:hypothetical protein
MNDLSGRTTVVVGASRGLGHGPWTTTSSQIFSGNLPVTKWWNCDGSFRK